MTNIYILDTPYHLFITIVKTMLSNRIGLDTVIITRDYIPQETIQNAKKIFKEVICDVGRICSLKKIFWLKLQQKNIPFISKKIKTRFTTFGFPKDSVFYIFYDNSYFGCWLNISKTYYNLIEDGLNHFKGEMIKTTKMKIYDFLYKLIGIYWNYGGYSEYIKSIEVNENNDLRIKHDNIIVKNRAKMFEKLTIKDINTIANIFNYHPLNKEDSGNKTLLLTQPLSEDSIISHIAKIKLYQYLVNNYSIGTLYIKVHPREKENYSKLFPNAIILGNQNVPFEIYLLKENFHFNRAITAFSTAIDAVFCADEKISMGSEWVINFSKSH